MFSIISFILVVFGGVNWLSIGLLQFDMIAGIFGTQSSVFSRVIYIIIGVAAVYLTYLSIARKGVIKLSNCPVDKAKNSKQEMPKNENKNNSGNPNANANSENNQNKENSDYKKYDI